MWDIFRLTAVGGFLLRRNTLILAGLLSALFVATVQTTSVFADSATWEGTAIKYQNNTYTKIQNPPTMPGISSDKQHFYQYADPANPSNVSVIALVNDADKTREITDAQIANFTKDEGNNYTSAGPPSALTIAASTSGDGEAAASGEGEGDAVTGCAIDGIGWIICGPSRWIANGMDLIYGWISDFLVVKPLSTDTDNGMHQAWKIALGFANALFIVVFLVIIYAHITSYGISNYEIKKMIPKLIIVAILVNVSYYICAVAIDLSNILGNSVQSAMMEIRESLASTRPDGDNLNFDFKNITEFILSGGAIGAAGYAAFTAAAGTTVGGMVSSMAIMLVPVLVAGLLAVAVALIILAARQAIITILVILAPLALVAYVLPNTEKWFEKWRGLFLTMLMVFPLFSLLFGGSQLASYLIMQNADQLTMILLALFVQVAPLALTPFLVQFSGSLLGRLAGMVNNPQKGIIDNTRNWAKDRAETRAAEKREQIAKHGGGTRLQRAALNRELGQKNRDQWKKRGEVYTDALWHNDERYQDNHAAISEGEMRSKYGETKANRHFEREKAKPNSSLSRYVQGQRLADDEIKSLQTQENADWESAKSDKMQAGNRFASTTVRSKAILEAQKIADGQAMFAQSEQSDEWAKLLLSDEILQAKVGGIGGKDRALAQAVHGFRKNFGERIGEGKAVMDHYNFSSTERQEHAMGRTIHVDDGYGGLKAFRADSTYTREAAIDTQVRQGTVKEIEEITAESGGMLKGFATTIQSAAAEAKVSGKAVYFGGQSLDMIGQGVVVGQEGLNGMVRNTLLKGKVKASDLAVNEADALKRMLAVAQNTAAVPPADQAVFTQKVQSMQQAAYEALTNPSLKGNVSDSARVELNKMIRLGGKIYDANGIEVIPVTGRVY